jgi:hypothetical protein
MAYRIRRSPIFLRDVEDFGRYCADYSLEFADEQFERLTFAIETLIVEAPLTWVYTCFVSVSERDFGSSIRPTKKRAPSASSAYGARRAIPGGLRSNAGLSRAALRLFVGAVMLWLGRR